MRLASLYECFTVIPSFETKQSAISWPYIVPVTWMDGWSIFIEVMTALG